MYRYLLIAALGALALGAPAGNAAPAAAETPAAGEPAAPAQEPFRWTGRVAQGKTLEVKGVSGTIRALPASGREVEVVAVRRAGRSDPESVRIEVVPHDGGVTVCAVYPRGSRGRRAEPAAGHNRCDPGEWNDLNVQDNDVKVDFTVRVPAGVRLAARNVSGDVEAEGMRGWVEARSVSGDVRLSTTGYGEASTVSGEIFASLGSAAWSGGLEFSSVSGDVTVEIPAGAGTDVRIRTMSGEVETDFPLEVERRSMRRSVRGTLGGGGRELAVTTLSGDVRLRRAR
jgi:hypothetical protein